MVVGPVRAVGTGPPDPGWAWDPSGEAEEDRRCPEAGRHSPPASPSKVTRDSRRGKGGGEELPQAPHASIHPKRTAF